MVSLRSGLWGCLSFCLLAAQAARAAIALDIDDDSQFSSNIDSVFLLFLRRVLIVAVVLLRK